MPIFYYGQVQDDVMTVQYSNPQPETLPTNVLQTGIILPIDEEPAPPTVTERGKTVVKRVNIPEKKVFFEVVDRPFTQEEMILERQEALDDALLKALVPSKGSAYKFLEIARKRALLTDEEVKEVVAAGTLTEEEGELLQSIKISF